MFYATVNAGEVSIGCFMFHFQEDPYPGGFTYEIVVQDAELAAELMEYFQSRSTERLARRDATHVFDAISLTVSLQCPQEKLANPIRFWANTIEQVTFPEGKVVIRGICSPHMYPVQ